MKIQNILIVSAIFLILLSSISIVSSSGEPFDWEVYGKGFSPLFNSQFITGEGKFNEGVVTQTMTQGITDGNQVLVSKLNSSEGEVFLVFANGNFLQVYDNSFTLVSEKFTTVNPEQLTILDFDGDGFNNDIASVFVINSSLFQIRVYTFAVVGQDLSLTFEKNFTTQTTPSVTGLRGFGGKLYFINNYKFFNSSFFANLTILNSTDETQIEFPTASTVYSEPVAFFDVDEDGVTDYLSFGNRKIAIVDENGVLKFEQNHSSTTTVLGANMLESCDLTFIQNIAEFFGFPVACNIDWRVAVLTRNFGLSIDTLNVNVFKLDGSLLWGDELSGLGELTSGDNKFGAMTIGDSYGGDGADVVYATMSSTGTNIRNKFRVYDGNDGTILNSRSLDGVGGFPNFLTLADLNENGFFDFIYASGSHIFVYEPVLDVFYVDEDDVSVGSGYCIPADLNNDGFTEVICSKSGNTKMYSSSFTNQNAFVNSISFDPSTTILINSTLNLFIVATDPEGQQIFFKHKCDTAENFTVLNNNPTKTCIYDSVGIKQLTVAVRDPFFATFNTFTVPITVTLSGTVCGDLVCEGLETNFNCAIDCPLTNVSQSGLSGSIPLPTELVELDNTNKGLLPEIYFGTIGFMSSVLSPTIVLVFLFFLVMIMVTVAIIIKKIAQRIGSVGG